MAQAAMENSTRAFALQRRKAMSVGGKTAIKPAAVTAVQASSTETATTPAAPIAPVTTATSVNARQASLARRKAMSTHGKTAAASNDRVRNAETRQMAKTAPVKTSRPARSASSDTSGVATGKRVTARTPVASNTAKAAALARRKALSTRGKAAIATTSTPVQPATQNAAPKMSGREMALAVRKERSRNGKVVKQQPNVTPAAAQDASWKVGASTTTTGQTVTGTMVGRQQNMTGDEPSTCRAITGTEYLGADIFNEFCQNNVMRPTTDRKVDVTSTLHGNAISGNRMGRGKNVTGNEPGSCQRVTGNQYTSNEQWTDFCGEFRKKTPRGTGPMASTMKYAGVSGTSVSRSGQVTGNLQGQDRNLTGTQYTRPAKVGYAPSKVGTSTTLRGGHVTGTIIGRRSGMTGDDRGDCQNITGNDYIGTEQYKGFCKSTPLATDNKVGVSKTLNGMLVTGNLASRSQSVTGDEPGTCKAVTGTPYASGDQYDNYCDPSQSNAAHARMRSHQKTYGMNMTGSQPGIGGHLTGAHKGACDPITGTPYVGANQVAETCPAVAAEPGSPDFPQAGDAWGNFSVKTPAHAAGYQKSSSNMTGSQFDGGNLITGSFGKGAGKLTGTGEAHFELANAGKSATPSRKEIQGRVKSRITGEGQDSGLKVTGDDWGRNEHVTGTEGLSSTRRNPTRRGGPMSAMQKREDMARPRDIPTPVSKVTGGSGNTDKGSLITYSGGARG